MRRISKWKMIAEEDFKKIIESSLSVMEIAYKCGYGAVTGRVHKQISSFIREKGYSTNHFRKIIVNYNVSNEEMFTEDSLVNRGSVKKRILKQGLLPDLCSECGQEPFWKGKKLILVLDHINGINNDHRLENLRFLCPNCNSQQDTFTGKNIGVSNADGRKVKQIEMLKEKDFLKKEDRNKEKEESSQIGRDRKELSERIVSVTKDQLIEVLKKTRSFEGTGRALGFSGQTAKSITKKFKIDYNHIFKLDYKKEEMISYYKEVNCVVKTGAFFKTDPVNIKRIIKDSVQLKEIKIVSNSQKEEIKKLRESGMKINDIANKIGICRSTVRKYK